MEWIGGRHIHSFAYPWKGGRRWRWGWAWSTWRSTPPPPPDRPVKSYDWAFCEEQDLIVAEEKAERDRIIKQYVDHGYAYKEFEVTDGEEL
jgi:hypothetical protein